MVSHAPPRKPQLQLDPNPLPTPLSKRPRADEDHEASFPKTKTKTRRSDECGPHLSDIVPPNAPRLASAPAPMNGDSSTPGPPMDFTPPGPHMGPFPVEKNQAAIRPSDTQKINQVPINTSHYTPTSKCSNTSAALTDEKSAASNMQGKSEAHGPPPIRTAYGEPSEPSVGLQNDRVSKAQAQPSVHTTALALSTSSTSSDEFTRWSCTPYQLIQVEGNKWCPRVTVSSNNELCPILGAGHHPIATAIAKIHQYGHENPVPHEAHQVLKMFDDIHVWHRDSHHVTLLDPALYDPNSHSQAQLEVFRKKEWGWLVRAGRPITFPGILCGEWHFVTIQANYEMLDIALVLSRGDHLVIFIPGHDYAHPPQTFQPIQLYRNPPHNSRTPVPQMMHEAWEDIAFCQRWIPTFASEDICAVLNYQYTQSALTPHHIDEIVRANFRGSCYAHLISWATNLKEPEMGARKARMFQSRFQANKRRSHQDILSVVGWRS